MLTFLRRLTNSIAELLLIYVGVVLLAGWLFAQMEHKPLNDSVWWAFATATTVGYGDFSPATTGGRIVAVVLTHVVLLLVIPLIVVRLTSRMIENEHEFTHDEQEHIKAALARIEAQLAVRPLD